MERLEASEKQVRHAADAGDLQIAKIARDWLRLKAEVDRQAEKIKWLERWQEECADG